MSLGRKVRSGKNAPAGEAAARAAEERTAEAAKTARLRALRLAKEAADRDPRLESALPQPVPGSVRRRRNGNGA
jgi:hypothetical protein